MLQRLHLLFLPWAESSAPPGKFLLSCTSLLQSPFCPPPSDVCDDFTARAQETSRDTREKKREREREAGIEDRKRVCLRNKKQKFIRKVYQDSRQCSQYSYNLVASPLALPFLLSILPLSCFGFRPGSRLQLSFSSSFQLQLKYVILGNLLKLCEPQIPNLKNENDAVAAAKSLQSCPTLCDPIDGSPPGSPIPGILQANNTGVGCHCLLKKKMRIIHLKKLLREINVMIYRQSLEYARVSSMLQNFFLYLLNSYGWHLLLIIP